MSDVQSTEPMSPVALREIADCSPARCHDALEWAADEIERLQAIDREFHNIDDVVEITTLKREVASWKAVAHDHSERLLDRWRPISTAPTDGTKVLLWFPDLAYPVVGPNEAYGYKTGGWKPTHWMPAPSAPRCTDCAHVGCTIQGPHEHGSNGPQQGTRG